jgi:S1-C subfamily serine protease
MSEFDTEQGSPAPDDGSGQPLRPEAPSGSPAGAPVWPPPPAQPGSGWNTAGAGATPNPPEPGSPAGGWPMPPVAVPTPPPSGGWSPIPGGPQAPPPAPGTGWSMTPGEGPTPPPPAPPGPGWPTGAGDSAPPPPATPPSGPWTTGAGPTPPPVPPAGGWAPPGGWTPPPSASGAPAAPRRRRVLPSVLTAALVAVAAAAGFGIGHEIWPGTSSPAASVAQGGSTSPSNSGSGSSGSGSSGSGSSGLGSSGSGSSGSGNSGSGNSSNPYGSYFGNSPFGSGNSGSPSYGESPFGSGGSTGTGNGSSSSGPSDTSAIAAKVDPALVDINSTFSYQSAQGAGTGIVLTSNGEVLTNNHVINGATSISVTDVGNGKTYSATVVGYSPTNDVAVIQLKGASGLQTAKIGNSAKAAAGQLVVAIGNAGGTGGTPTSAGGSITALNQSITASDDLDGTNEQLSGLIETNADVQPGDSGGSLVNTAGQVIGMDTAASEGVSFESSQSSGNQAYAIPIDSALSIARQIESGQGSSTVHVGSTAFLGILISGSSGSSGQSGYGDFGGFGNSGGSSTSGVTIGQVVNGAAAQEAGLTAGDVITSVAGQSVDSPTAISSVLINYHPGDKIQISWVDSSGQSHTSTVVLSSGPPA